MTLELNYLFINGAVQDGQQSEGNEIHDDEIQGNDVPSDVSLVVPEIGGDHLRFPKAINIS